MPKDLFDSAPGIAVNTAMLLFSSITYGFAMLEMDKDNQRKTQMWLAITGLFGVAFVTLEIREFVHLFLRARRRGAAPSCPRSTPWSGPTGCTSRSASCGS